MYLLNLYQICIYQHIINIRISQYKYNIDIQIENQENININPSLTETIPQMQLKQLHSFSPSKHAYHLQQNPSVNLSIHPSSLYFAFVTRGNQVCLYNRKTGRVTVLLASKHGFVSVMFTENYLLVSEKTMPDILVFSIKTQKLKKKLTGHRSQALHMSYCPHRRIFCSASHDVCIVWDESTLNSIKMLKCSTSSYCDCHFSNNGEYLFTAFEDGNVFGWDLQTYVPKQYALSIEPHQLASCCGRFVIAYTGKKISVADYSEKSLIFQQIDGFWEGYIQHVDFLDSFIFVKTSHGFYIAEIIKQHKIILRDPKQLIDQIYQFQICKFASEIVIVSKDLSKIRTMKVYSQALNGPIVPLTNPVINPGRQCIGGFSDQDGCLAENVNGQGYQYQYQNQNYKLEQLNDGMYHKPTPPNKFANLQPHKLQSFIRKNYIYPDKYRPLAYKTLLKLPITRQNFLQWQRKGRHPCTKMLDNKYPLDNISLAQAMKDVVSLLAHYSPVFAESQLIPAIVFPFVCVFGQDRFFCFEVLYRLFNNWLSCLFQNFPLANSQLLQNIQQIFQKQDPIILNHLKSHQLSFTKLAWTLLSTFFTSNLPRDGFLSIADTLLSHPQDPSFIVFVLIAYIEYNRTRIFTIKKQQDLDRFLNEEHTVNISTFLKKAYELRDRLKKYLRYPFRSVNQNQTHYLQYDCYPKHAVKMYEGKRKLQEQQYDKAINQMRYHDEIAKQMQKMVTKIKRQSDKAHIESEAVVLQSQNQCKNSINIPKPNNVERKRRLNALMERLQNLLQNRDNVKVRAREFIPLLAQMNQRENDEQLDQIQMKLMTLMSKLQPNQFTLPLNSQPITFGKQNVDNFKVLKAAKKSQFANKLWETDKMEHEIQQNKWEEDFDRAMKI